MKNKYLNFELYQSSDGSISAPQIEFNSLDNFNFLN